MKQRHYTEAELEAFLGEQNAEDSHLVACPRCREKLDFLVRLNTAFLKEPLTSPDPRVEKLVDQLSDMKILRLHPFLSPPDLSQFGARNDVVVLAAQGGTQGMAPFVTVGTFAEEREHILLRVIHDRERHSYSLYLLTKTPELAQHVRLIISVVGGTRREAVTDASGVAVISEDPSIDWREAVIAVEHHQP
jgi:hypothetical protein